MALKPPKQLGSLPETDSGRRIGQLIRQRRSELGYTQQELAERITVDPNHPVTRSEVANLEAGRRKKPTQNLLRGLQKIGIHVTDVLQAAGLLSAQESKAVAEVDRRLQKLKRLVERLDDENDDLFVEELNLLGRQRKDLLATREELLQRQASKQAQGEDLAYAERYLEAIRASLGNPETWDYNRRRWLLGVLGVEVVVYPPPAEKGGSATWQIRLGAEKIASSSSCSTEHKLRLLLRSL